jgi:uncharacterized membrane protein YeaQ/YmgE (transglycosylase-associated protein family)
VNTTKLVLSLMLFALWCGVVTGAIAHILLPYSWDALLGLAAFCFSGLLGALVMDWFEERIGHPR